MRDGTEKGGIEALKKRSEREEGGGNTRWKQKQKESTSPYAKGDGKKEQGGQQRVFSIREIFLWCT